MRRKQYVTDIIRTPIGTSLCLFVAELRKLHEELVNSSWCGVLAALSLLLDARYGPPHGEL